MLRTLLADAFCFLTFRPMGPAVREHRGAYLAFGLACTWLAGVGRYWDNPRAEWWQVAGLGSVLYALALSTILWVLLAPLRPKNWTYPNVLLFVALTAPPALLYAIPVERLLSAGDARTANAWFLLLVAAWRVALLVVFLRRTAVLDREEAAVGTVLPLSLVVIALSLLNLEHVVFQMMRGAEPDMSGPNDTAFLVVLVLSFLAWVLGPSAAIGYVLLVLRGRKT